jgi:small subunit ribosomal protein S17
MIEKLITRVGVVVSDKMQKNCLVKVTRSVMHPLYKKSVKRSKKYVVHDEKNEARLGDKVEFIDCRPLSKRCSHRLLSVIQKASKVEVL